MILEQLLKGFHPVEVRGSLDKDITNINIDSRQVQPGGEARSSVHVQEECQAKG